MSKPSNPQSAADQELAYGIARVGASLVGFSLDQMSEVCRLQDLHPLLISSSALLGGLNLRGHMIPVLDLQGLCGFPARARGPFAVIVRRQERLVAFPVDEVIGIARVLPDKVQGLAHPGLGRSCVHSVFLDGTRSISIVDLEEIFALPEVYSVAAPQIVQARVEDGQREPVLIFDVGGARFSVRAEDVYGTVPRQTIEVNAITSGFCMGSITYHKRRVPVLNSAAVFGLGALSEKAQTEVVVLRCEGDRLLGLAVDSIQDVRAIDRRQYLAIPRMVGIGGDFFSGVLVREDGTQIYTIAIDRFLADPRVASITGLSTPVAGVAAAAVARGEVERYLVYKAGRVFATPLSQVSCILQPPGRVVPMTHPMMGLEGFFARDQASVPLVDLNTRLGAETTRSGLERVLLIGEGEDMLGFRVERVFSIENSAWVLKGLPSEGEGAEPLVQLGRGEDRRALPVLNLELLRSEYFVPAPRPGMQLSLN